MLDAVPAEIRACPQWLVWRKVFNAERGKWDKHPLSVITGKRCDVTDPNSWCDFARAAGAVYHYGKQYDLTGCGFVLGYQSGVVGVDLDNVLHSDGRIASELNHAIADKLNSYTELSPSRTGLHVLTQASFNGGRRVDGVEVYGQGRFFTMTGESYGAPRPLSQRQLEIDALISEIDERRQTNAPRPLDWTSEGSSDDRYVYDMAMSAVNGEKFKALWDGHWRLHYTSQSEADYALINMLGFYSDAPAQIARMFRMCALGQRPKAQRTDYLSYMIGLSQDRKPPLVQIPALPPTQTVAPVLAPAVTINHKPEVMLDAEDTAEAAARADDAFQAPEGLVRSLAEWFYLQSIYPMKELATVGALGLLAGIVGRQYQFHRQGLNLYMMVLAETGAGKDALGTGMSRIFDAVCNPAPNFDPTQPIDLGFPAARCFHGPSAITGKGLIRSFMDASSLSMVSVLPEFSQTMTTMSDPRANEGVRDFQRVLLEFYTKSAEGASFGGSRSADKAKDVGVMASPAFTMLCEGTPQRFYNALTDTMITDGLLSRFIIIEKEGYTDHNPRHVEYAKVPDSITAAVAGLCRHVLQLKTNGDLRIHVQMSPDAETYSERLRIDYRNRGIKATGDVHKYLWMRAHQNIARIAALLAVGVDYSHPTVTVKHLEWANRIIYRQVMLIVGKFKRGEVGKLENDESAQYAAVLDVFEKWAVAPPEQIAARRFYAEARSAGLIPHSFIVERSHRISCIKRDRRGPATALRLVIEAMEKSGTLEKVRMKVGDADAPPGLFYRVHL